MNLQEQRIFIPIEITDDKNLSKANYFLAQQPYTPLKESSKIVLTKEQLIELLKECFGAGSIYRSQDITGHNTPDFEDFLESKSLTNPPTDAAQKQKS